MSFLLKLVFITALLLATSKCEDYKKFADGVKAFLCDLSDKVTDFLPYSAKITDKNLTGNEKFEFDEYLSSLDETSLVDLAKRMEDHIKGDKNIIGGMHDYVRNMDKTGLITFIKEKYYKSKEQFENFDFKQKLNDVIHTSLSFLNDEIEITKKINSTPTLNYLKSLNKSDLINLALKLEKYDRTDKKMILGGLHDYVNSLSEEKIIEEINKLLDNHPYLNLNNLINIDELINRKTIKNSSDLNKNLRKDSENNSKKHPEHNCEDKEKEVYTNIQKIIKGINGNNKNIFNGRVLMAIPQDISEFIESLTRDKIIALYVNLEHDFGRGDYDARDIKYETDETLKGKIEKIIEEKKDLIKTKADLEKYTTN